jgi:hypothetical protein
MNGTGKILSRQLPKELPACFLPLLMVFISPPTVDPIASAARSIL